MNFTRFIKVNQRKLHFYTLGQGPVLVMLHPSPSTGEALLPLAKQLASEYMVFCVDTPGYGESDALVENPTSLTDYTSFLHLAFGELGLKQFSIYGSATGAQLAVRYGLEYPEEVSHIFLDNSAHFDDALSDKILEHYFPDLTPCLDGGHLTEIWTIVSKLFQYFPWCFTTEEYALNRPQMPLFVLQLIAMDYLKAGSTYDTAYKLAFQHERAKYVQQLRVPTTIFRWNNSIITKYVDALLNHRFDKHIQGFMIEGDANERTQKMVTHIIEKRANLSTFDINLKVMRKSLKNRPYYKSPESFPPEAREDGKHLKEAWEDLIKNNPDTNAVTIQEYLVDWYSNN